MCSGEEWKKIFLFSQFPSTRFLECRRRMFGNQTTFVIDSPRAVRMGEPHCDPPSWTWPPSWPSLYRLTSRERWNRMRSWLCSSKSGARYCGGNMSAPSMLLTKASFGKWALRRWSPQYRAEGEVVEDYPADKYGPSGLNLGLTKAARPIHLQFSYPNRPLIRIIMLYEPDPGRWEDFRVRKQGQWDEFTWKKQWLKRKSRTPWSTVGDLILLSICQHACAGRLRNNPFALKSWSTCKLWSRGEEAR